MPLDPVKRGLEAVDQHGAEQKRHAQPQRVAQQHGHALPHVPLLGGQHQRRAQKRPHAGRPPHREHHPEHSRGEKVQVAGVHAAPPAAEQLELEHAQKVQAEQDHHQAAHQVDGGLVAVEKAAHRAGQRPHSDKQHGKAQHKAAGAGQRAPGAALAAARKVGQVDGQHGQQAGRNKGDDAFQERDQILHGRLLAVEYAAIIPDGRAGDKGQPAGPRRGRRGGTKKYRIGLDSRRNTEYDKYKGG